MLKSNGFLTEVNRWQLGEEESFYSKSGAFGLCASEKDMQYARGGLREVAHSFWPSAPSGNQV